MNLIYDRTQTDINNALSIRSKYQALGDWAGITEEEIAQLKRGTYTCFDDMNRVDAAVRDIGAKLTAAGYPVRYTSPVPQPEPEYTPLSYIESTGTQYIDTDIIPTANTRIECELKYTGGKNVFKPLFAARNSVGSAESLVLQVTNTNLYRCILGQQSTDSIPVDDELHQFACGANFGFYVDKKQYGEAISEPIDTHYSIYIFGANNGIDTSVATPMLLTYYKIYENDILIRDFVPAEKDGIVGLYDRIGKKMYGNSGTGEFISGGTGEYTQLTYIESSGSQYIDTGYKPNNNTRVVCKVSDFPATKTNQTLFGSRTGTGASDAFCFLTTNSNYYRTDYSSNSGNYSASINISGDLIIDKNKNVTLLNGANQKTLATATFSSTHNLYIGAMNNGGTPNFYTTDVKYELVQIYDNGVLVRDYIPAMQNGISGLYDKVEQKMYGNSGAGDFIAGEVIPQPDPEPVPVVTEFAVGDIISYGIWQIYLDNVQALRDAYYTMIGTPKLPEPTAPLTFGGANAIEKLVFDVQVLYYAMLTSYRKCGTFQSGTNSQRLPLQRSVT